MVCLERNTWFIYCAENIGFQRRFEIFLSLWQQDRVVSTVSDVAFSCLEDSCRQLWKVVTREYWARKQHFQMPFRTRHNLFVGRHNTEIFSIMPTDRSGLYFLFPCWLGEYK